MPRVFIYAVHDHEQRAAEACAARLGLNVERVFRDEPDSWRKPWAIRSAGHALYAQLKPGDLIVAPAKAIMTAAADTIATVEDLQRRGIQLQLVEDPRTPTDNPEGSGALLALAAQTYLNLRRSYRSERTALALRAKKASGARHTRHAGYGCRWQGRPGQQVRADDPGELAVMAQIHELRQSGLSFERIAVTLLRQRVLTREGREWSASRCRRAHAAFVARS